MHRAVVAIAVLVLTLGAGWPSPVPAAGDVASKPQPMQPFRQIWIDGDADVALVQGNAETITIEVSGGSTVHAAVEDGVLKIHAADERRWWDNLLGGKPRPPRISVTFRDLEALRASGKVKLSADRLRSDTLTLRFSGSATMTIGALEAKTLAINGSGAFKADVAGRVDEQRISISGAGDYRALDLVSDRASINVSGVGRVLVNAQKTLDVDCSGAAKVDYAGDPKVTQRTSGAARIRRVDAERARDDDARPLSAAPPCRSGSCPA